MKLYAFPIAFALFASALFADSIPTYFALSATVAQESGNASMSAQGPFFQISGLYPNFFKFLVSPGEGVPVQIVFSDVDRFSVGSVDFLGNGVFGRALLSGSISASGTGFTLPPNPKSSYTFSASAGGQFTASLAEPCGPGSPPGTPPCGSTANIVIDLPGIITVGVSKYSTNPDCAQSPGPSPCLYELSETFVSTPEPSSAALAILSSGAIFLALTKARTKGRRD